MVQAAKLASARRIIAVDPIAYRRELAGSLGATDLVDPGVEDPVAQVRRSQRDGERITCSRRPRSPQHRRRRF